MNISAPKFARIVEILVEELSAAKLMHIDVSMALAKALESQGITFGDVQAEGEYFTIPVVVDGETYDHLQTVVKNCNESDKAAEGITSHGQLDVPGLLAILAEDAAMTNSRPGSWEGANMQQVLDSHGYQ